MWKRNYVGLSDKLKHTVVGPFSITRIDTNGMVTIQLSASVQERINIRPIRPKFPILSDPPLHETFDDVAEDPVLDPTMGVDPL